MLVRTLSITRKEILHILRDPRTLAVMFLIPVVQLLLLGYAATTDVLHLPTAVLDRDRSSRSRALVDAFRASGYFDLVSTVEGEDSLVRAMDSGQVRAGLIIPASYAQALERNEKARVLVIIRAVVLKGVGFEMLQGEVLALALFGVAVLGIAAARFRKRLE